MLSTGRPLHAWQEQGSGGLREHVSLFGQLMLGPDHQEEAMDRRFIAMVERGGQCIGAVQGSPLRVPAGCQAHSIGNAITELLGVVVNRVADADAYGKHEPRLLERLLEVRRRLVEADLGEGIATAHWPKE